MLKKKKAMRRHQAPTALSAPSADGETFVVRPTTKHKISPLLYSLFLETEINFGGEGGLYAEQIRNRDFEALGRGNLGEYWTVADFFDKMRKPPERVPGLDLFEPAAIPTDYRPWQGVGEANLRIDTSSAPFATNPHTLIVQGPPGSGCSNPGYWGIAIDGPLRLKLHAKVWGGGRVRLAARLLVGSELLGERVLRLGGDDWRAYGETTLTPARSSGAARLELVLLDAATISLDAVSLVPQNAVAGIFRRDLFSRLQGLRPGFVRMPGGNYLEGFGPRTRWSWKATLGQPAARPGHFNAAWGYWVTDGLGVYELLLLAELLGAPAQLSIFTGYVLRGRYDASETHKFAREAVDLLAFANGDMGSEWGLQRAAMGHLKPFGLRRLQVGNEELHMHDYRAAWSVIAGAVRLADPTVLLVGSGRWDGPVQNYWNRELKNNPCLLPLPHGCEVWCVPLASPSTHVRVARAPDASNLTLSPVLRRDEHFYRAPDELAEMATLYDNADRSGPKIFVGEFAAAEPLTLPHAPLQSAVAEARFLIGLERNADVVTAAAFAPLLSHVHGAQWGYNLINFNATAHFVHPSYHVWHMFREALGERTLVSTSSSPPSAAWLASASAPLELAASGPVPIAVKLANYGPAPCKLNVLFEGWGGDTRVLTANATALSGARTAANSLEQPHAVEPRPLQVRVRTDGAGVLVRLPPWAVVVLSVRVGCLRVGHACRRGPWLVAPAAQPEVEL